MQKTSVYYVQCFSPYRRQKLLRRKRRKGEWGPRRRGIDNRLFVEVEDNV